MKCLLVVLLISVSIQANASSVLEDIIDFASAAASAGHYLKLREMNEAEIELEIEKRLAKKLDQITSLALRNKIEFNKNVIKRDMQELNRITQLYGKTNSALTLAKEMRGLVNDKVNNKLVLSANAQSLMDTASTQIENLKLLESLYARAKDASNKSGSTADERNPVFIYFNEHISAVAKEYGLQADDLATLAVYLENNESLGKQDERYYEQELVLKSFKIRLLARQKRLNRRIDLYKLSLDKLT